ncbi:DNA polymerase III subunit gamma/tau [Marinicella sp. W31]|uniref:DNA polymerase III subunit gamma/tau n=1 Tax=Marinicella sp. W31 TaxID=3023713 RepID=UPI003756D352
MSYQVLARKFRPQNFKEIVGQEHVVQALVNGLDNDRVHHAYLFTGTRGVGKTTLARVLAKALNCERGVSGNPCGECQHCKEIKNGEFLDLIEVDAASRTGVDDTRELLENVQYAPSKGRYKIYLIDEVHMFSKSSFNALLKTLEEPPEHVKFLLATTEQDKLPITVLSRCLQFNLKRLTQEQIGNHLCHLLETESISYESSAIQLIARAADGSMRDALSLLDQALAFGAGKITDQEIRKMLGAIEQNHVIELLQLIVQQDKAGVFQKISEIEMLSVNYGQLLNDFAQLMHEISLFKVFGQVSSEVAFDAQVIKQLAQDIDDERLQLYYQIANIGREQLSMAPSQKVGFEMTVIRLLSFELPVLTEGASAPQVKKNNKITPAKITEPQAVNPQVQPRETTPQAVVQEAPQVTLSSLTAESWPQIFSGLQLKGTGRELARNINVLENKEKRITFGISTEAQVFLTTGAKQALLDKLGAEAQGYTVHFQPTDDLQTVARQQMVVENEQQQKKQQQTSSSPVVQQLQEQFGAKIINSE